MMQAFATGRETLALLLESGAWLAAGGLVGAFHFLSLRSSARMLATASAPSAALALHLVRFAVTAGALIVIARHGALPLLAATLGLVAARTAVLQAVSRVRETPRGIMAGISPRDAAMGFAGLANASIPRGGAMGAGVRASPPAPSMLDPEPLGGGRIAGPNKGPRPRP